MRWTSLGSHKGALDSWRLPALQKIDIKPLLRQKRGYNDSVDFLVVHLNVRCNCCLASSQKTWPNLTSSSWPNAEVPGLGFPYNPSYAHRDRPLAVPLKTCPQPPCLTGVPNGEKDGGVCDSASLKELKEFSGMGHRAPLACSGSWFGSCCIRLPGVLLWYLDCWHCSWCF